MNTISLPADVVAGLIEKGVLDVSVAGAKRASAGPVGVRKAGRKSTRSSPRTARASVATPGDLPEAIKASLKPGVATSAGSIAKSLKLSTPAVNKAFKSLVKAGAVKGVPGRRFILA